MAIGCVSLTKRTRTVCPHTFDSFERHMGIGGGPYCWTAGKCCPIDDDL